MANVNKAIVVGHLGRAPELKHLNDGTAVTTLSVATSRRIRDRDGNSKEETEWHSVVVFGRQAENAAKYLTKGSEAVVDGRLRTRKYTDRSGVDHWRTEIVCENLTFGAKPKESQGQAESAPAPGSDDGDIPF